MTAITIRLVEKEREGEEGEERRRGGGRKEGCAHYVGIIKTATAFCDDVPQQMPL